MRNRKKDINEFFTDGHLNEETIAFCSEALFSGKINSIDDTIKRHLKDCISCKEEVFAVFEEINSNETLKSQLVENAGKLLHTRPESNVKNVWMKIAASLLVIIGIGLLYYFLIAKPDSTVDSKKASVYGNDTLLKEEHKDDHKSAGISVEKNDSIANPEKQQHNENELLALNMKESEFYENLISSDFRDDNTFKVTEPEIDRSYKIGEKVEFKFDGNLSDPVELTIYKNSGEKIFRTDSIKTSVYVYPQMLNKGLYYWKIRINKELTDAGKFYIR